jgi:hypothetical protein
VAKDEPLKTDRQPSDRPPNRSARAQARCLRAGRLPPRRQRAADSILAFDFWGTSISPTGLPLRSTNTSFPAPFCSTSLRHKTIVAAWIESVFSRYMPRLYARHIFFYPQMGQRPILYQHGASPHDPMRVKSCGLKAYFISWADHAAIAL